MTTIKTVRAGGRWDGAGVCAAIGLLLSFTLAAETRPKKAASGARPKLSTRQIADRVRPALVLVETFAPDGQPVGIGSGFFLGSTGNVMTNLHVLKWASTARIKAFGDGVTYPVTTVFAVNVASDLCILHVQSTKLKGLDISIGADVAPGDPIIVAGNPKGLEATISRGIVSAVRTESGLLQIDAPISAGSSGGPVVNEVGDVIGVVVSTYVGGQNLNFAVPTYRPFKVHQVDWGVKDVAILALSDVEYQHYRGRPQSVVTSSAKVSYDSQTGRYVEGPQIESERESFNSDGMRLAGAYLYFNGVAGMTLRFEYQDGSVIKTLGGTDPDDRTSPDTEYGWLGGAAKRRLWIRYSDSDAIDKNCRAAVIRSERPKCTYWLESRDASGNTVTSENYGVFSGKDRYRVTLVTREFDNSGRLVENRLSTDGTLDSVWRYTYETDAVGNWTKQTRIDVDPQSGEETVVEITYRRIKYF